MLANPKRVKYQLSTPNLGLDLMRATTVSQHRPGVTLRDLATESPEPWPGIFRDHHDRLRATPRDELRPFGERAIHQLAEATLGLLQLPCVHDGSPVTSQTD